MSDPTLPTEDRFTLSIPTGASSTEVRVGRGLLDRLPVLLSEHVPSPAYAVVSDATVAELYGGAVRDGLRAGGSAAELFRFPAGEVSKTPGQWTELVEGLGEMGMGRDGCVVAVGGGVTGDLAGFAAAAYARGISLVQVPTSLLAMIDASIGGKTGVDLRAGKNLAGAFHDPVLVVADPAVLETLPLEELRGGLAEAVKHGAIADARYLERLTASAEAILEREPGSIDLVVAGSMRVKVGVVERDARESGERAILNFGHTIGHALERVTGYVVPHGRAVAVGMVVEAWIGERLGVTDPGTTAGVKAAVEAFGLPGALPPGVDRAAVIEATRSDKKAREGAARYALISRIGQAARAPDGAWTHPVTQSDVTDALAAL